MSFRALAVLLGLAFLELVFGLSGVVLALGERQMAKIYAGWTFGKWSGSTPGHFWALDSILFWDTQDGRVISAIYLNTLNTGA